MFAFETKSIKTNPVNGISTKRNYFFCHFLVKLDYFSQEVKLFFSEFAHIYLVILIIYLVYFCRARNFVLSRFNVPYRISMYRVSHTFTSINKII